MSAVTKRVKYDLQERVDWWLEEADDECVSCSLRADRDPPDVRATTHSVFVLRTDCELPEELISFERLLLLSEDEWAKTAKKSKLPKPKADADVFAVAIDVLEARLKEYPTTLVVSC